MKIKHRIQDHIADTLFIPLFMKHQQNNEKESFYKDQYASDMVRKIDYNFKKYENAKRSSVGVAIRSKYFDELTDDFIKTHKNPVIVILGCGLDTRFCRLNDKESKTAIFYELDLDEVIELRQKLLPQTDNNIYIKGSMFDTGWMDKIKNKHKNAQFLFIIEGVLMYFDQKKIKEFFVNLSEKFRNSKVIFDVVSSWMCKNSHKHDSIKFSKAKFIYGCDNDNEMECWSSRLKLESTKSYIDFKEWKRAGVLSCWAMKIIPVLKKSSRLLCYRID